MQQAIQGLNDWVSFLSKADIPVLKQTARNLEEVHADEARLSARSVAQVIAVDPMMTAKLLRYLQEHKRRSQEHEVMLVEQALIMLGVEAFFNKVPAQPLLQDVMKDHLDALVHLLHVLRRAHRASEYAFDWAVRMSDLHYEEVRHAALLHDLAEILMWCFAPQEMLTIHKMQKEDRTLRTRAAQEHVFGFNLLDMQKQLVREWHLPELLLTLMDDACVNLPRVRNVILAVNLARHSAQGWDDAALPDDYKEIAELLRMTPEQVMAMLGVDTETTGDSNKPAP